MLRRRKHDRDRRYCFKIKSKLLHLHFQERSNENPALADDKPTETTQDKEKSTAEDTTVNKGDVTGAPPDSSWISVVSSSGRLVR